MYPRVISDLGLSCLFLSASWDYKCEPSHPSVHQTLSHIPTLRENVVYYYIGPGQSLPLHTVWGLSLRRAIVLPADRTSGVPRGLSLLSLTASVFTSHPLQAVYDLPFNPNDGICMFTYIRSHAPECCMFLSCWFWGGNQLVQEPLPMPGSVSSLWAEGGGFHSTVTKWRP